MAQAPADDLVLSIETVIHFSGRPTCLLTWGERRGQLTPDEVRALALSWLEAAEAAETDAVVLELLEQEDDFTPDKRERFLQDLQRRRNLP
jgi:hypothetical protein